MMSTSADPSLGDWLIVAGLQYPGVRCCLADRHPLLMTLAREAAELQARRGRCGHPGWGDRFQKILAEVSGAKTAAEISAQSWPWQTDAAPLTVASEMFRSWEQSPGHWKTASRLPRWVGGWMARSRKGIWFASIITAD